MGVHANSYNATAADVCALHNTHMHARTPVSVPLAAKRATVWLENQLIPATLHLMDGLHHLFLPQGKEA